MNTLWKFTWVELKLFVREPITVVFTFALPVIILLVLGGVFVNEASPEVWGGVRPIDFYTPAYVGLVLTALGVVGLPVHITAYRERRVLRRLRASSISVWTVLGSQVLVTLTFALVGSLVIFGIAVVSFDAGTPESYGTLVPAFLLGALSFSALGFFLGAIMPTTRAAQGIGIILFFVMMILGGGGPPREVMPTAMRYVGNCTPVWYVVQTLQGPWLGKGWNIEASLVVAGITVAATVLSARFFKWE